MNKNKKWVFIIFVGVLVGLLIYRFITYYFWVNSNNFRVIYENQEAADEENYSEQCKWEFENRIVFPNEQVSKAVVFYGFFAFDKELNDKHTKRLLEILNDTASYIWGEIGTFIPDTKIVFYNAKNKPIGMTELEEEGGFQSYSRPYLKRTKWGALNGKALNEIRKLIIE